MSFWMYVKRFLFYGGITALITVPIAYKVGYNRGTLDSTMKQISSNQECSSRLEKVMDDQFKVTNPDDHRKYLLDFKEKIIAPYSGYLGDKKQLEDLFAK